MEEDPDKALAHDRRLDEISHQFEELIKDRQNLIKDLDKIYQAPLKVETPDGKEPTSKSTGTGYNFYYKNPVTGEPLTKYEALELKYNDMREDNARLLRRVAPRPEGARVSYCSVKCITSAVSSLKPIESVTSLRISCVRYASSSMRCANS